MRSLERAIDLVVKHLKMAALNADTVASWGVATSHPYRALGNTLVRISIALSFLR